MEPEYRRLAVIAGSLALVVQVAAMSSLASAETVKPAGTTRGFVITKFLQPQNFDLYKGDEDCPDGYSEGLGEVALKRMPPGPQKDEALKATRGGVAVAMKQPVDQCINPTAHEMPPLKSVKGAFARGMNLDGGNADVEPDSATTCAHPSFVSPNGERGIDNQFYRAVGCTHAYREKVPYGGGYFEQNFQGARKDGEMTMLIEVTGVQDDKNDDDVEVGFYSSEEATLFDSQGAAIPNNSYTAMSAPKYRAVAHGRIKDGILTTDPVDIRAYFKWVLKHEDDVYYYIRGARLRLELAPNGEAKGMLGGYWDVDMAYKLLFTRGLTKGDGSGAQMLAAGFGYTCPSAYGALHSLADGYKDPTTGKCTGISTVFDVAAIPAFVILDGDQAATATDQKR